MADNVSFSSIFCLLPAYPGEDARVASQPGIELGTVRWPPAIGGMIAVAGAAGPEFAPGAAAYGLAHEPGLAAAINGGMALLWA